MTLLDMDCKKNAFFRFFFYIATNIQINIITFRPNFCAKLKPNFQSCFDLLRSYFLGIYKQNLHLANCIFENNAETEFTIL